MPADDGFRLCDHTDFLFEVAGEDKIFTVVEVFGIATGFFPGFFGKGNGAGGRKEGVTVVV